MEARAEAFLMATTASEAQRYEDAVRYLRYIAETYHQFTESERLLFSSAWHKNTLLTLRLTWNRIDGEAELINSSASAAKKYKARLAEELSAKTYDAISLIDTHLLPFATSSPILSAGTTLSYQSSPLEPWIYYMTKKADYNRYLIELLIDKLDEKKNNNKNTNANITDANNNNANNNHNHNPNMKLPLPAGKHYSQFKKSQQQQNDENNSNNDNHYDCDYDNDMKNEMIKLSHACYQLAYDSALASLGPLHPTRLAVALNYSVFKYEILVQVEAACQMAQHALDEAIAFFDDIVEDGTYHVETLICQYLRDNLTAWAQDLPS